MWEELSALTHAFFVASLRANTSCTKDRAGAARHLDWRAIADDHLDLRLLAAVEHIGDQGRSGGAPSRGTGEPSSLAYKIAVGVLADPVKRL